MNKSFKKQAGAVRHSGSAYRVVNVNPSDLGVCFSVPGFQGAHVLKLRNYENKDEPGVLVSEDD